jgi:hypothetical protein
MKNKTMKTHLIICALGIILLFTSMQPGTPLYAAYPPFGLVTLLFLGVSSYMLLVGMVGSAAYVSRDSKVRREVYQGVKGDPRVLQMGVAEMQREIERRVTNAVSKIKLSESSSELKMPEIPDEDVKAMISDVMKEVESRSSRMKSSMK